VVLLAIVVSQLFAPRPSAAVFVGCGVVAALDVFFGWYFFRQGDRRLSSPRTRSPSPGRIAAG
jgi:hypothetical protein